MRGKEKFEDTKGVIKTNQRTDKKWPKENGQRTNNVLQSITQKTKDCIKYSPLKTGGELVCSGRVHSSF